MRLLLHTLVLLLTLSVSSCVTFRNDTLDNCDIVTNDFTHGREAAAMPISQTEVALVIQNDDGSMDLMLIVPEEVASSDELEAVGYNNRCIYDNVVVRYQFLSQAAPLLPGA